MTAFTTRPQLTFDEKRHIYLLDGVRLPSVTQILGVIRKPGLEQWRGRVGNTEADRISKESADFGTLVHKNIELYNREGELWPDYDAVARPWVEVYNRWFVDNVSIVLGAEMRMVCIAHQFCGTADLICEMTDGSIAVVDIKTSKQLDETFALQLSAYTHLLREWEEITVDRRLVVQMPSDRPGALIVHEFAVEDAQRDWRAFLACSIIWHRLFKAEAFAPRRNILGKRP